MVEEKKISLLGDLYSLWEICKSLHRLMMGKRSK